ncbi:MAG: hypothetical protein ACFFCV_11725 [Promethearchaeota archaeon]
MAKNISKTPSRTSRSSSTLNKNKSFGKMTTKKIIEKKKSKEAKSSGKKNVKPIKKIKISYEEYPNKSKTVIQEYNKASRPLQSESMMKGTKNQEKAQKSMQAKNWDDTSHNMLVDNIFNKLLKKKHIKSNKAEKEKKEEDSKESLKDKQKKWFDNLQQSMKNSMKEFNDAQKKALDNLEKAIKDKLSSKDKEDEFLKEMLLILLAQNAFSKDLQNLGQVNVSTTNRESYL